MNLDELMKNLIFVEQPPFIQNYPSSSSSSSSSPSHFLGNIELLNGTFSKKRVDQVFMGIDPSVQRFPTAMGSSNFQVAEMGYYENPVALPTMAASSCGDSPAAAGGEGKRRCGDEVTEKSIERRQRRMIKNRESAARSRARKQAYTNQLEHEVFQLRRTNYWLKKQKEVEMILNSDLASNPRYQLRRTSSATF